MVVADVPWRSVAVPGDVEQVRYAVADGERAVFPVRGVDGVRRLVVGGGGGTEVVGGGGGVLRGVLAGSTLVVQDQDVAGVARVSTVDLKTGVKRVLVEKVRLGALVAVDGLVVLQEGQECLRVFAGAGEGVAHCPPEGSTISLLTAGPRDVRWRETAPAEACANWFRLEPGGRPQRVEAGEGACRAVGATWLDGWEITTGVTPYEAGAAYPGPLVARRDGREFALDTTVLDAEVCGRHLYWLSRPRYPDQLGEVVRWRPGADRVEVLDTGGPAWPPRCVNGTLAVSTAGPRLLVLAEP
ncbi:hypothetical protein GCM10010492_66310 [Saccharothrix mutabilis subsp. mutabilis]|uniref:Uncharacterized protein n=1 Tax=Saccharothrix mutabilis subsp. mutabilis TaxID=66855 RepID=A0ABN0UN60_9PSEU